MRAIVEDIQVLEEIKRNTIQANEEVNDRINEITPMIKKMEELAQSDLLGNLICLK